jgi:hypothetical protein
MFVLGRHHDCVDTSKCGARGTQSVERRRRRPCRRARDERFEGRGHSRHVTLEIGADQPRSRQTVLFGQLKSCCPGGNHRGVDRRRSRYPQHGMCRATRVFDPQLPRRLLTVERPALDDPSASADDAEDPIERAIGRRACHL